MNKFTIQELEVLSLKELYVILSRIITVLKDTENHKLNAIKNRKAIKVTKEASVKPVIKAKLRTKKVLPLKTKFAKLVKKSKKEVKPKIKKVKE